MFFFQINTNFIFSLENQLFLLKIAVGIAGIYFD